MSERCYRVRGQHPDGSWQQRRFFTKRTAEATANIWGTRRSRWDNEAQAMVPLPVLTNITVTPGTISWEGDDE